MQKYTYKEFALLKGLSERLKNVFHSDHLLGFSISKQEEHCSVWVSPPLSISISYCEIISFSTAEAISNKEGIPKDKIVIQQKLNQKWYNSVQLCSLHSHPLVSLDSLLHAEINI